MSDDEPVLRVVNGAPTDDELAALVTVVSARARAARPATASHPSTWSAYWNSHRPPVTPGVDAWRRSALPR
ncbi:acyl-CoA carboxylase subunit epsilon [Haloactinopolyspora alba]|uniref:acyl-CoA carboxylase subunit epsilon n=1 Tax=Haloactinopolyspora alba TaxID=648780 RepID=UPI000D0DEDA1|nr:acyl-CoA carboxylase subunit epsilon [Haloactinopolyspora alba]